MRAATLLLVVAGIGLTGCGSSRSTGASTSAPPARTISGVDALRRSFNADAGRARLLVAFSPT